MLSLYMYEMNTQTGGVVHCSATVSPTKVLPSTELEIANTTDSAENFLKGWKILCVVPNNIINYTQSTCMRYRTYFIGYNIITKCRSLWDLHTECQNWCKTHCSLAFSEQIYMYTDMDVDCCSTYIYTYSTHTHTVHIQSGNDCSQLRGRGQEGWRRFPS